MRTDRTKRLGCIFPSMILVLVVQAIAVGQTRSLKDAILGVWRGTSICTKVAGNEACHDETVVYELVDQSHRIDTVTLKANKIVNGEFVPMYDLDFAYKPDQKRWTAEFQNSRVHILWSFEIEGDRMAGTCVDLPSLVVRRNVSVKKDSHQQPLPIDPAPARE